MIARCNARPGVEIALHFARCLSLDHNPRWTSIADGQWSLSNTARLIILLPAPCMVDSQTTIGYTEEKSLLYISGVSCIRMVSVVGPYIYIYIYMVCASS